MPFYGSHADGPVWTLKALRTAWHRYRGNLPAAVLAPEALFSGVRAELRMPAGTCHAEAGQPEVSSLPRPLSF